MTDENITLSKAELREKFIRQRNNLNRSKLTQYSDIITEKILNNIHFQKADSIFVYIPFKNEVDIRRVIEYAWKMKKKVLAPKIEKAEKKMYPYAIISWQDLEKGSFNLFEPVLTKKKSFPISDIEVVLIPGVAFDKRGYRLGYGGGYYDRFFAVCKTNIYKIGIAYDFQIIEEKLPILDYDCPVDEIITEKQNITINI